MIKRVITVAIALPPVVAILVSPYPILFTALLAVASGFLIWEILQFSGKKIEPHILVITAISLVALYLVKYAYFFQNKSMQSVETAYIGILFFQVFAIGFFDIFRKNFESALPHLGLSLVALFWGGMMLSYGIDLRFGEWIRHTRHESLDQFLSGLLAPQPAQMTGVIYLFFVIAICWMYDSGAYIFGSIFGGKKIGLPASPNKSWAGLVGGIVASVLTYFLFDWICRKFYFDIYTHTFFVKSTSHNVILAVVLALVTQVGDLIESVMKRSAGVKDSGTILVGHGGMYDGIDSLIPSFFLFNLYLVHGVSHFLK